MIITFQSVSKRFKDTVAVDQLSLTVQDGELVCLLGPSGCGKSTTLAMLSGLEQPTSGDILFDHQVITQISAEKRDIGMVFQNYALYPHMTVEENITFPLKMRKVPKKEQAPKVEEMLELLHLWELRNRKPAQLSGGQQQRVAIARALVKKPTLLLLDEPFSNLDARLRLELREEIKQLQQKLGITTLFVTHDQEEALSISDRIVVMNQGKVQQFSTPKALYDQPANPFVAGFIGNPPMNFFTAEYNAEAHTLIASSLCLAPRLLDGDLTTGEKLVGVRPEDILPTSKGVPAAITALQPVGKEIYLRLAVGELSLLSVVSWNTPYRLGEQIQIELQKARLFPEGSVSC